MFDKLPYDKEKVRELLIEGLGDEFVDFYIMDIPNLSIFSLFVKSKTEDDWDTVIAEERDFVSRYFSELNRWVAIYISPKMEGEMIYVRPKE
ncbi:MAG: hypothetical protein FWG68_02940 [Defluviitaleaceae bacterium]|nr:hypothetical protein [Defluviitaleaceae bacterium]